MSRGIRCPSCGASTPLPEDLRVPTFACAFCHTTLTTAHFAGESAVSADALLGHMAQAIAVPPADLGASIRSAPRFRDGNTATRADACKDCGAAVEVPLALEVHTFSCGSCGKEQRIERYVSDRERLELDMKRQVEGNAALARVRAEGLHCGSCGAHNAVPADASVQFPCAFCGTVILLGEHADAAAVARRRMADGVFAMRDELVRKQEEHDRRVKRAVLTAVVVALVVVFLVRLFAPGN